MAALDRDTIQLTVSGTAVQFPIARGKNKERLFKLTTRASQPGDPGDLVTAEWDVSGPDLNSYEEIPLGQPIGFLGRDWGEGTDGRWEGMDQLAPAINTISLGAYDNPAGIALLGSTLMGTTFILGGAETVATAHAQADIAANGTQYGYIARGQRYGKVDETTMTLVPGTARLTNNVTDVVATYSSQAGIGGEVSLGQGDTTPYQVIQESGVGTVLSSDSPAANSQGIAANKFGIAPDRIVSLYGNTVAGNVIDDTAVTMLNPVWNTVAKVKGRAGHLRLTGFAMDGSLWMVGTSGGPQMLDQTAAIFFPVISELDNNVLNCLQMGHWFPLGVIIPLTSSVRYARGTWGKSFGPETYLGNTSPVQGLVTGFCASARWGYVTIYNAQTGDTYLCAIQPHRVTDPKPNEVSWFTLAKFTALQSLYLDFIGTANGLRTNETVMGGYGSNCFYMTNGRTAREYQDSNYRNQLSGTTYLTELRRQPGILKDIEVVELETAQCDANNTVQLAAAITTSAGVTSTVNIGSATTTNGLHRVAASSAGVPLTTVTGVRIKPQHTLTASAATASPQVIGKERYTYRLRQTTIRVWTLVLSMPDRTDRSSLELELALRNAESSNGPIRFDYFDQISVYVRVRFMTDQELKETLGAVNSQDGIERQVGISLTEWTTA